MSTLSTIIIDTHGEKFHQITDKVKSEAKKLTGSKSGLLYLFLPHTSCGLLIQESFDPSAKSDMEKFLKHLAPRDLNFIEHTAEGPDDSPSHMKSIVSGHTLTLIVDNGQLVLGQWQGIYLSEFRDGAHSRKIHLKFLEG